jgi:D-alanyl-D-alanine carboxypeptidase/D-alanyl-D-alanine-endopeptidase (penicillin-binding protein 4)
MKLSQNLYAETLLKTLGAVSGAPTFEGGRAAVRSTLAPWGLPAGELIQVDGSGLSRYGYATAATLVEILAHVDRDDKLRGPYEGSLPIAGRDGTLAGRLGGTRAEGNVRAKTGTMSNVRTIAGYITSRDGDPIVFAILANNFESAPDAIVRTIDSIVVRLVDFQH